MKKILTLVLILGLIGYSLAQDEGSRVSKVSVAGGSAVTDITSTPWVVKIERNGFSTCTGVLISDRLVLTAAHCVTCNDNCEDRGAPPYDDKTPFPVAEWKVYYGSSVVNSTNQRQYPIKRH